VSNKRYLTPIDVSVLAGELASKIIDATSLLNIPVLSLYGVPRGGVPAMWAVQCKLNELGAKTTVVNSPDLADVIIDDIADSGKTINKFLEGITIFSRPKLLATLITSDVELVDVAGGVNEKKEWIVFPWEENNIGSAEDIPLRMLQYIGEDVKRSGLLETPKRVVKAWDEWFSGYKTDVTGLFKTFEDGAENVDAMVILTNIPVFSHCEHHLAPFHGVAHVGYIPNGAIVGLSKIARVVDAFSRRLQVQERLTNQIADAIEVNLRPLGVGVVVKAQHTCMSTRGACVTGVDTITSAMRGVLQHEASARAEFFSLIKGV
jgi:GTP cyclohydrolase I